MPSIRETGLQGVFGVAPGTRPHDPVTPQPSPPGLSLSLLCPLRGEPSSDLNRGRGVELPGLRRVDGADVR